MNVNVVACVLCADSTLRTDAFSTLVLLIARCRNLYSMQRQIKNMLNAVRFPFLGALNQPHNIVMVAGQKRFIEKLFLHFYLVVICVAK